jgi:Ca2+/H+ antiporter, TMEM165/GDT1 family
MLSGWAHAGTAVAASFLASLVEFVEALTIVLAAASVAGWRAALAGTGIAVVVLAALVGVFGRALNVVPLAAAQIVVGALLLVFGLRWLRKAVLRSAGVIAMHDEQAAYEVQRTALSQRQVTAVSGGLAAFQGVAIEGVEVVFIVLATGTGGQLVPATLGATAAMVVVVGLGLLLRAPLARVPENTLKFAVGVMLTAFGIFWIGEGAGLVWPGGDWSLVVLVVALWLMARGAVSARRVATSR